MVCVILSEMFFLVLTQTWMLKRCHGSEKRSVSKPLVMIEVG